MEDEDNVVPAILHDVYAGPHNGEGRLKVEYSGFNWFGKLEKG